MPTKNGPVPPPCGCATLLGARVMRCYKMAGHAGPHRASMWTGRGETSWSDAVRTPTHVVVT